MTAATATSARTPSWVTLEQDEGSVRAIAVLRIALGVITLLHLRPFLRDARASVSYTDHFWEPFVSWFPELPPRLWFALLWTGAGAATAMAAGLYTRLAAAVTFGVVAGNLLLSQTHYHHNRAFLAILLGGVALLPSGRVLSIDAWWRRRRGRPLPDMAPLWPLWLLRAQVCLVYLASGVSKLLDPDWVGGLVLWDRVVRFRHVLDPWPVPAWMLEVLTSRWLFAVVGPAAVGTELFIAAGLWPTRTRSAATWVALMFHLAIEVTLSVEVFSYAAISALAIWVTPVTRDRAVRVPATAVAAVSRALRVFDWFGRFRVEPADSTATRLSVVDRNGDVVGGFPALLLLASRLPVTFPLAAPLRLVVVMRRRRRRADPERAVLHGART